MKALHNRQHSIYCHPCGEKTAKNVQNCGFKPNLLLWGSLTYLDQIWHARVYPRSTLTCKISHRFNVALEGRKTHNFTFF